MNRLHWFLLLLLNAPDLLAQIPNSNMEYWNNGPVLQDWVTNSHPLTLPAWEPYIVRKDSDAFAGKYAAGFYANGLFRAEAHTTFPLSAHPKQLELWYKLRFAPCVNDSGSPDQDTVSIRIDLLNKGQVVDSGRWESSLSKNQYTQLTIPLSQQAMGFDSCRISISGGKVFGGCGIIAEATYFLVDSFSLRYNDCHAGFEFSVEPDGWVSLLAENSEGEWYWMMDDSIIPAVDTLKFKIDSVSFDKICRILYNASSNCRDTVCITSQEIDLAYLVLQTHPVKLTNKPWKVYPNPLHYSDPFFITNLQINQGYHLRIMDIKGEEILSRNIISGESSSIAFPALSLPPGIYLLEVEKEASAERHFILLKVVPE